MSRTPNRRRRNPNRTRDIACAIFVGTTVCAFTFGNFYAAILGFTS